MPRGDKSAYTDKQKRQAEHIEESYESRGVSHEEAEQRAWATVNKISGGGKKSGSGRGHSENKAPVKKRWPQRRRSGGSPSSRSACRLRSQGLRHSQENCLNPRSSYEIRIRFLHPGLLDMPPKLLPTRHDPLPRVRWAACGAYPFPNDDKLRRSVPDSRPIHDERFAPCDVSVPSLCRPV